MLEVLDLSRDLPCLQAGLTKSAALHQPFDLCVENPNLVTFFAELVIEGTVADDFGQGTPVVESGNLLSEDVKGGGRPHEESPEPAREGLWRVLDIVRGGEKQFDNMRGFALCLVLAKPSHTSVVELLDPFGEDSGPVGARDIKRGGPPHIGLVSLWTFGMLDFVVFDASLECLNLNA
jgi:hypothetical protein